MIDRQQGGNGNYVRGLRGVAVAIAIGGAAIGCGSSSDASGSGPAEVMAPGTSDCTFNGREGDANPTLISDDEAARVWPGEMIIPGEATQTGDAVVVVRPVIELGLGGAVEQAGRTFVSGDEQISVDYFEPEQLARATFYIDTKLVDPADPAKMEQFDACVDDTPERHLGPALSAVTTEGVVSLLDETSMRDTLLLAPVYEQVSGGIRLSEMEMAGVFGMALTPSEVEASGVLAGASDVTGYVPVNPAR